MQKTHVVSEASGQLVFRLPPSPTPADFSELRAAAARALEGDVGGLTIDLDGAGLLDSRIIAALLAIRREHGEGRLRLTLRARTKRVSDTLRITGLGKLFAVDSAVAPLPRRARRAGACAFALLTAGLASGTPGRATPETDPAALVARVTAQNAEMRSYQARISVDAQMRNFPYVAVHLDGTTYFKRPDNFEVVFEKVPSYAKGFERIYSDIGDPSSWPKRFTMSVVGEKTVGGHADVVVRLVQKVRGMIDHEDVAIDPVAARIDDMEWHYYNGGVISMSQDYEPVGQFSLLARQHATIHIPYVHASAEAAYTNYHTNVAIDDSVFTKEKK
jgi:anti-anti-sigma regulatory factor